MCLGPFSAETRSSPAIPGPGSDLANPQGSSLASKNVIGIVPVPSSSGWNTAGLTPVPGLRPAAANPTLFHTATCPLGPDIRIVATARSLPSVRPSAPSTSPAHRLAVVDQLPFVCAYACVGLTGQDSCVLCPGRPVKMCRGPAFTHSHHHTLHIDTSRKLGDSRLGAVACCR